MKTTAIMIGIIGFLGSTVALAGPGDYRENKKLAALARLRLSCPSGSTLVVQDGKLGVEETCITADGVRHGYYLQWHKNSQSWAVLGRYRNGKRTGRWITFSPSDPRRRTARWY